MIWYRHDARGRILATYTGRPPPGPRVVAAPPGTSPRTHGVLAGAVVPLDVLPDQGADPPAPIDPDTAEVRAHPRLIALRAMTPQEAAAWVEANVTNLAQAKETLAALAALCVYLLRRDP